jgi:hypothetical protein
MEKIKQARYEICTVQRKTILCSEQSKERENFNLSHGWLAEHVFLFL